MDQLSPIAASPASRALNQLLHCLLLPPPASAPNPAKPIIDTASAPKKKRTSPHPLSISPETATARATAPPGRRADLRGGARAGRRRTAATCTPLASSPSSHRSLPLPLHPDTDRPTTAGTGGRGGYGRPPPPPFPSRLGPGGVRRRRLPPALPPPSAPCVFMCCRCYRKP